MEADEIAVPETLRTVLALAVCCQNRWAEGATTALRRIWAESESDADATEKVRLVTRVLSPSEKFWLGTFSGERKARPA